MHVDVIKEASDLPVGVVIVAIFREVDCLLFDGADQPLGVAVLRNRADFDYAD